MANRILKEINFDFEGVAYKLRPDFETQCEIEDRCNETIPVMISKLQERQTLKVRQLVGILYGGLLGTGTYRVPFKDFSDNIISLGLVKIQELGYQSAAIELLCSCVVGRVEKKTELALSPVPSNE